MTYKEIETKIAAIKESSGDDETAHGAEDQLRAEFISFVAKAAKGNLQKKAKLVLSTDKIRFCRWCA
jgi:hypothetical protein